jgi:PD-(D/E)XK nuclease superfamily
VTTSDSRRAAVDALARLPLFQLSTAGMELFHTNMLYWLALHQPAESAPVWNALGLHSVRADGQEPFIEREWHHLDLVFCSGPGRETLVIENKIGAIPTAEQLVREAETVARLAPSMKFGELKYVLLTLTAPSPGLPGPWRSVVYRDLLDELRETARRVSGEDAHVVSAYVELVAQLDAVARAYDPDVNLDEAVLLPASEREHLARGRVLSLVDKVRVGRFAQLATCAQPPEIRPAGPVGAALYHTVGLNDWFVNGRPGRQFGWQIQGNQFRLAVMFIGPHNKSREAREQEVTEHYNDYFDFTPPEALKGRLTPHQGKKLFLGFDPDMVYRYATLAPETTWHDLLGLTTFFSGHAHEYALKHREQS